MTTPPEEGSVTPAVAWLDDAYRYLPEDPNVLAVLSTIPAQGALRGSTLVAVLFQHGEPLTELARLRMLPVSRSLLVF